LYLTKKMKQNFSYITNTCQNLNIYTRLNIPYNTPFIGSYMQDDAQYVNFCINYDYYVAQEPVFKEPLQAQDSQSPIGVDYPVMFLGDFEIHWIHETSAADLLVKYKRRLERSRTTTPLFLWGDNLTLNDHSEGELNILKRQFTKKCLSIYIDKADVAAWKHESMSDRVETLGHGKPLAWNTFDNVCRASDIFLAKCLTFVDI
jgi:uncharacterized protein (DUF1919 family)